MKRSARAQARRDAEVVLLAAFHGEVERRAGGRCQARIVVTEGPRICRDVGDQAHHVVTRGRGRGWPGLHEPENGLWVCAPCHEWIHSHPEIATQLGFLKSAPTVRTP